MKNRAVAERAPGYKQYLSPGKTGFPVVFSAAYDHLVETVLGDVVRIAVQSPEIQSFFHKSFYYIAVISDENKIAAAVLFCHMTAQTVSICSVHERIISK